jgi:hypothetical protein
VSRRVPATRPKGLGALYAALNLAYTEYCANVCGLAPAEIGSADEMLADEALTAEQRAWFWRFIDLYESTPEE